MTPQPTTENRFLTAPLGRLFAANALPMMFMMLMNGLLTVVDAAFLGHFVGANALTAVGLLFPVMMVTVALSTLVSGGMSSLLARHLGAKNHAAATGVFAQAHGLALFLSLALILAFLLGGTAFVGQLADGQTDVASMAYTYLAIMVLASPPQFLLAVHADAWRNEGRAGLIALMSVGVTLANVALNYLLIVTFQWGVAGSALGTAVAQATGLVMLVMLRSRGNGTLRVSGLRTAPWTGAWRALLALGAPVSLSFIGIALVSATVITALRLTAGADYLDSVAAYGIVTRILSFTFLPLMAIALATQTIVGNNVGAGLYGRSDAILRLALVTAFLYCGLVEATLLLANSRVGGWFVTDPAVVAEVSRALVPMLTLYLFTGPVLVLALYFQAIGKPARTAALTLVKPFALTPLLLAAMGLLIGAEAIWFAFPVADGIIIIIAAGVAIASARHRSRGPGFGLSRSAGTV